MYNERVVVVSGPSRQNGENFEWLWCGKGVGPFKIFKFPLGPLAATANYSTSWMDWLALLIDKGTRWSQWGTLRNVVKSRVWGTVEETNNSPISNYRKDCNWNKCQHQCPMKSDNSLPICSNEGLLAGSLFQHLSMRFPSWKGHFGGMFSLAPFMISTITCTLSRWSNGRSPFVKTSHTKNN